jgi:hypothetical protein
LIQPRGVPQCGTIAGESFDGGTFERHDVDHR